MSEADTATPSADGEPLAEAPAAPADQTPAGDNAPATETETPVSVDTLAVPGDDDNSGIEKSKSRKKKKKKTPRGGATGSESANEDDFSIVPPADAADVPAAIEETPAEAADVVPVANGDADAGMCAECGTKKASKSMYDASSGETTKLCTNCHARHQRTQRRNAANGGGDDGGGGGGDHQPSAFDQFNTMRRAQLRDETADFKPGRMSWYISGLLVKCPCLIMWFVSQIIILAVVLLAAAARAEEEDHETEKMEVLLAYDSDGDRCLSAEEFDRWVDDVRSLEVPSMYSNTKAEHDEHGHGEDHEEHDGEEEHEEHDGEEEHEGENHEEEHLDGGHCESAAEMFAELNSGPASSCNNQGARNLDAEELEKAAAELFVGMLSGCADIPGAPVAAELLSEHAPPYNPLAEGMSREQFRDTFAELFESASGDDDEHEGHNHRKRGSGRWRRRRAPYRHRWVLRRRKRAGPVAHDDHGDHHAHEGELTAEQCPSSDQLFNRTDVDGNQHVNLAELTRAVAIMFEMLSIGCPLYYAEAAMRAMCAGEEAEGPPSAAVTWAAAIGMSLLLSLTSLAGLALIPFQKKAFRDAVLAPLVAFAIGTLLGDALLHLIPGILNIHAHGDVFEVNYLITMSVVLLGIMTFFGVERCLEIRTGGGHSHVPNETEMMGLAPPAPSSPTKGGRTGTRTSTTTVRTSRRPRRSTSSAQRERTSSRGHHYGPRGWPGQAGVHGASLQQQQQHACYVCGRGYADVAMMRAHMSARHPEIVSNEYWFRPDVAAGMYGQLPSSSSQMQVQARGPVFTYGQVPPPSPNPRRPTMVASRIADRLSTWAPPREELQERYSRYSERQRRESRVDEDKVDRLLQPVAEEEEKRILAVGYLNLISDAVHNLLDGVAIGAAFSLSVSAGLSLSLAAFLHELPSELGDFVVLLQSGFTKKRALQLNFMTAVISVVGAVIGVAAGQYLTGAITFILAFTAGGFLYVALADLLQFLGNDMSVRGSLIHGFSMLLGIALMAVIGIIEQVNDAHCGE